MVDMLEVVVCVVEDVGEGEAVCGRDGVALPVGVPLRVGEAVVVWVADRVSVEDAVSVRVRVRVSVSDGVQVWVYVGMTVNVSARGEHSERSCADRGRSTYGCNSL